ncbi:MAG: TetR/AcrR family transcriptional regulator [Eubacteriales bacterium]|nr:TetR/AcrR family transcriptional regulator [Eubacteriales bacterium]
MNENDLRVIKTLEAVESSFLDMLEELPFEKITVRELSRRAKINTGTFYLHFQNMDDLYDKLIQAFFDEFIASIDYFPLFILQPELFLEKLRNTVHQKVTDCRRLFKHRDMSLSEPCVIKLLQTKIYESCPLEVSKENDIRLEAVLTSLFHMNLKYDQECPEIIQKVFSDMIRGLFVSP